MLSEMLIKKRFTNLNPLKPIHSGHDFTGRVSGKPFNT